MKKVAVAMSVVVDSAVSGLLLRDKGLEVAGVTMCLGSLRRRGKSEVLRKIGGAAPYFLRDD